MLDEYIENLKQDIIKETCNLISFPSVSDETQARENMPFGKAANDVLEYVLNLGDRLGFKTKNIDGYCGYIEFGEGENLVGIIGHLDVVPAGDGWDTPPFEATVKENKIYGRGAIDDKGPVVSALYAMKAIKDNFKINARVRLILGLNEEKDWKCINYYKEHEELPNIGFSPDADFPCIYAEKGIVSMYLEQEKQKQESIEIKAIDCNNNAINVVPKYCKVQLRLDETKININEIKEFIIEKIKQLDYNIVCTVNHSEIDLISHGIQAHAAHPDLGTNAISQMIVCLSQIFKKYNIKNNILTFFEKYIGTEINGKSLGINIQDESGKLTLNVGDFLLENDNIKIGLNLRIPVNTPVQNIIYIISDLCGKNSIKTYHTNLQEPLYVSKNSELVKKLTTIFNKVNKSNYEPVAIGGGTYARALTNCVSFGPNFPGDIDLCHQSNENIDIDKLIKSCKIYAIAIQELANRSKK